MRTPDLPDGFEDLPVEDEASPPTVTTPAAKGRGKRERTGLEELSPPTATGPKANGEKARGDKAAAEAAAWKAVNRAAAAGTRQGEFMLLREPVDDLEPGVYRQRVVKDPATGVPLPTWVRVCSPLEVVADSRDAASERWGCLLLVADRAGVVHEWVMPEAMLADIGTDLRKALVDLGLRLEHARGARDDLAAYLTAWVPPKLMISVDRTGWHKGVFVLPDAVFGDSGDERVVLQAAGSVPAYEIAGSLEGWREEVARLAVGNSRLAFAVSASFAGPLLDPLDAEGGGFHLCGPSSIGKTTALRCAGSSWGLDFQSWRTTDNAIEGTARSVTHTMLCLDESGQADPRVVGEIVYTLANGIGKRRARRDGSSREAATWLLLFLSTGEAGLAAKLLEIGKRAKAGQEVRLVELPADAGAGFGLFEDLHGFAGGAALATHLRLATRRHKGHAARAFLEAVVADLEAVVGTAQALREAWLKEHLPEGADGQVARVAARFATVAAAGELATAFGILPWPEGEADEAAATCFRAWLETRGGAGPAEVREALAQVRGYLERHGSSRFEAAWAKDGGGPEEPEPDPHARTFDRAGFRKLVEKRWRYFVLPEMWRQEVCKGLDATTVAKAMAAAGHLEKGDGKNLTRNVWVPGHGTQRVYAIKPGFLTWEGEP